MYYLRFTFATRPLTVLDSLRIGPYFALKTLERTGKMQLGPQGCRRRSGLKSGEGSPESGRGRAGEGHMVYYGSICGLVGGEGLPAGVDRGTRRRPPLERLLRRGERHRLRAGTLRGSRVIAGKGR
jgi:hypothetical protein